MISVLPDQTPEQFADYTEYLAGRAMPVKKALHLRQLSALSVVTLLAPGKDL